jgi:hypothetical protein
MTTFDARYVPPDFSDVFRERSHGCHNFYPESPQMSVLVGLSRWCPRSERHLLVFFP